MNRSRTRAAAITLFSVILATGQALATCGGGGGGGMGGFMPSSRSPEPTVYRVPWKVMSPGVGITGESLLVAYWFPLSPDDARASDLTNSRTLTGYAAQCVTLALVPAERNDLAEKYAVSGKLPIVIIAEADGPEIRRVESSNGKLRLSDVERAIKDVVRAKEDELDKRLDDAEKLARGGEKEKAIAAYRDIYAQRCLFPKIAKGAAKALDKLGVPVAAIGPVPDLGDRMNKEMVRIMTAGLVAENKGDYETARKFYEQARATDPGDPVPLRCLGELERHHTGEWDKARKHFDEILAMNADPLSRAVAMHGLGKMTIHEGSSEKGLALFEQSVATYPLALTYRNLAVYWNSEGQLEKAHGYVEKALALDPKDSYNLIFAAVYLAEQGHTDEAVKIAKENEATLPASYNLAAIYAISGDRDKAISLLRRHFFQYERYDNVRAMEMWEARVDIVFKSIKNDPEFVEMTKMAR